MRRVWSGLECRRDWHLRPEPVCPAPEWSESREWPADRMDCRRLPEPERPLPPERRKDCRPLPGQLPPQVTPFPPVPPPECPTQARSDRSELAPVPASANRPRAREKRCAKSNAERSEPA